jgi:hypothetical protein
VLAASGLGKAFQERREYFQVGSGENIHVFDAPGKPLATKLLPIAITRW